jgi:dihydroorotase
VKKTVMATLFTNAHIIDPAQGIDGSAELLVEDGKVAAIAPQIPTTPNVQRVDLQGAFLTPGWIDLHGHVFDTVGDFCLPPDDVGVRSGVTTVVDAGTSGVLTFSAFRETVVKPAKTRVYALLDPSLLYIATSDFIAHRLGFAASARNQDIERAAAIVEANQDIIVGFKVRPVMFSGESTSPVMDAALTLAEAYNLPLMVHLGRFPADEVLPTEALLNLLRPGDIVTHCFQPRYGLFDLEGQLIPEAKAAIDRGILLDVGHSNADFSIETARAGLAQGIVPNSLSTDLNCFNIDVVGSLASVMTKFVNLGLSLSDVVERVTIRPAQAMQKADELGSLAPGRVADFTVMQWVDEAATLEDGRGGTMQVSQLLQVKGVCRAGEFMPIDRSPFAAELSTDELIPVMV